MRSPLPASNNSVILAIDIGTSSTRASLYDAQTALPIAGSAAAIKHEPYKTSDGGETLDAATLVAEVIDCVQKALITRDDRPVLGVAVCTFWHSALGVDENGTALTPVLLWSDRRSVEQVQALRGELDAEAYRARTGCPLHVSYLPGRLRYLSETEPATFARCKRWLSPGEYLFAQLFGLDRVTCSHSMASASGMFNQHRQDWDTETIALIPGLKASHFSPVSDEPVSGIVDKFAHALAPLANVPWFPAVGDGACSNIGAGSVSPETLALMVGTSGALRIVVPTDGTPPVAPPGLWRYQLDRKRFLLGGALSNGGSVWAWLGDTLRLPHVSEDALEAQIAALEPDAHGLTVLPFFAGERAPLWRDDLRATIHGLSATTTPVEIVRAHLEAVALRFRGLRVALEKVAPRGTAQIIGTGAGLLASPTWAQIIADALGEPLLLSDEAQASSRGAVLLARERLGYGLLESAPAPALLQTLPFYRYAYPQ